ncbi:MAG: zf-HC2 domain-containing protein [Labilithrix sp.]|nr:zf-HC2 domain-containing protein [Labilithrix sp.]
MDRETSRCGSLARLLGAHADGQLDAASTLEVDDHLGRCEACRERVALDRAIRGSLKKAVKTTTPDDVRARMLAAMAGQSARDAKQRAETAADTAAAVAELDAASSERDGETGRPVMLRHWRTMLPLSAAAAIALAWGFAGQQPMAVADSSARLGAGFSNDELVNQFVDVHRRPIRPETPDPKEVRAFEREVGVPVHVPQLEKNARFVGGRLLPVQGGERAAMLQYEVAQANGGVQRVSVFIYDPRRVQIRSAEQLPPRSVGTAQVRVGQAHGYSLAVAQHGPVGYAVASDLEDSSAQYVVAADRE